MDTILIASLLLLNINNTQLNDSTICTIDNINTKTAKKTIDYSTKEVLIHYQGAWYDILGRKIKEDKMD